MVKEKGLERFWGIFRKGENENKTLGRNSWTDKDSRKIQWGFEGPAPYGSRSGGSITESSKDVERKREREEREKSTIEGKHELTWKRARGRERERERPRLVSIPCIYRVEACESLKCHSLMLNLSLCPRQNSPGNKGNIGFSFFGRSLTKKLKCLSEVQWEVDTSSRMTFAWDLHMQLWRTMFFL